VLDYGLRKVTLPVAVVLDVEVESPERARLEIDLPPMDAIPEVIPGVNAIN
jgi:hypothetical protein